MCIYLVYTVYGSKGLNICPPFPRLAISRRPWGVVPVERDGFIQVHPWLLTHCNIEISWNPWLCRSKQLHVVALTNSLRRHAYILASCNHAPLQKFNVLDLSPGRSFCVNSLIAAPWQQSAALYRLMVFQNDGFQFCMIRVWFLKNNFGTLTSAMSPSWMQWWAFLNMILWCKLLQ